MSTMLQFERTNDWDPMCDDDGPRVLMSCGHITTRDFLKDWYRRKLDEGTCILKCPALVEGNKLCNKPLSYQEVRRLADLSTEEMQYFEDTIARLAVAEYCEIQTCPWCKTNVERTDLSNLCVQCTICTADKETTRDRLRQVESLIGKPLLFFGHPIAPTATTDRHFCWQCRREWKGPAPRSDRCDNAGCINGILQLLQTCATVGLPEVKGVTSCPSIRVCPTCGMKVEHNQQHCKNIYCPRCRVPFCFVCLKVKQECIKTSSPYEMCWSGVAPRQTSIPVWKRK